MKKFNSFWGVVFYIVKHPINKGRPLKAVLRTLSWQFYKRIAGFPIVYTLKNNLRMILTKDCVVSSAVVYVGEPEYEEVDFLRKHCTSNSIMLDVGANVGHFSLLFADKFSEIHAFEPTPLTFNRLTDNFLINKEKKLFSYNVAMADYCGTGKFYSVGSVATTNKLVNSSMSSNNTIDVSVTTIDRFVLEKNIKNIGLLKIDVEGNEFQVLNGAIECLTKIKPQYIMFEIQKKADGPEFVRFFKKFNYVVFMIDKHGTIQTDEIGENDNALAAPTTIFNALTSSKL